MALFGSLEYLAGRLAHDARFAPGFAYLRRVMAEGSADAERIRGMADGKHIDIQFVLSGEERIDVLPIGGLRVEHPYDEGKDEAIYADDPAGSALRIKAGEAAIFFPEDGHMPGQSFGNPALIRKTVVKVPVVPPA